jgi:hypothetical protein
MLINFHSGLPARGGLVWNLSLFEKGFSMIRRPGKSTTRRAGMTNHGELSQ